MFSEEPSVSMISQDKSSMIKSRPQASSYPVVVQSNNDARPSRSRFRRLGGPDAAENSRQTMRQACWLAVSFWRNPNNSFRQGLLLVRAATNDLYDLTSLLRIPFMSGVELDVCACFCELAPGVDNCQQDRSETLCVFIAFRQLRNNVYCTHTPCRILQQKVSGMLM